MVVQVVAVDLGHDERYVVLHTKGGTVVYGYRAVLGGNWRQFAADRGGCGDEGEVNLAEQFGRGEFDLDLLAPELELLADGTLGGAEANGLQREVTLFEDVEEDLSHGARRADNSNAALVQSDTLPSARFGKMIAVRPKAYQGKGPN